VYTLFHVRHVRDEKEVGRSSLLLKPSSSQEKPGKDSASLYTCYENDIFVCIFFLFVIIRMEYYEMLSWNRNKSNALHFPVILFGIHSQA